MKAIKYIIICVAVLSALFVAYLVYNARFGTLAIKTKERQKILKTLEKGKTTEQIVEILGTPDRSDTVATENKIRFHYFMPRISSDLITVTFINNSSESYYDGN